MICTKVRCYLSYLIDNWLFSIFSALCVQCQGMITPTFLSVNSTKYRICPTVIINQVEVLEQSIKRYLTLWAQQDLQSREELHIV